MATYHLTVKGGAKGKAAPHAEYISRDGKYSGGDRYEDLEATAYGNMPKWAEHNPAHFWQASDQNERANGMAYREIEVALPRELTPEQRRDLVEAFVSQKIGDSHAYQWAIHTPKAALEKGEQPHAHIMYSERRQDGIERDPSHYFKRYNAKNPERGGCQKGDSTGATQAERLAKRKAELLELRESWANLQNKHLERHGHAATVDHRSLKDQGSTRTAEKHLGGSGVRLLDANRASALLEHRAAEGERERAQRELSSVIEQSPALAAAKASRSKPDLHIPKSVEPTEKTGFLAKVKEIFTPKPKVSHADEMYLARKKAAEDAALKPSREEKIIQAVIVPQAAPIKREIIAFVQTKPTTKAVPPKETQQQKPAAPAEKPPELITPETLKKRYEEMPIKEVFEAYKDLKRDGVPADKIHPEIIRRVVEHSKQQASKQAEVVKPIEQEKPAIKRPEPPKDKGLER